MEFWTAISLGLLGSFHCVGMCGPVAMALPVGRGTTSSKFINIITYNFGRVFTYFILGMIFGFLGKGFVIAGLQQWLSIISGILIIVSVFSFGNFLEKFSPTSKWLQLTSKLKLSLSKQFSKTTLTSKFVIGLLNGLLPCGLVYIAIAGAITSGTPLDGAIYMALFGLGTVPVMVSLFVVKDFVSLAFRNKIKKAMPVFIVIVGVLFILRGMNLGIPYVSPEMSKTEAVAKCYHAPDSVSTQ